MLPELFHIGPLTLHTYGLMVALGILAGVSLAEYLSRWTGGTPGQVVDMALVVVLSGLAGARLLFVAVNFKYYLSSPLEVLMIWRGGLVFYGGLLGGLAGLAGYIRVAGMELWPTLDIVAPAMALGHALGRLGCFTAGCCYGAETNLPWAVVFTDPKCLATDVLGVPVHPTQLYSFVFLIFLTIFLVWLTIRKRFHGQVAALYVGLYSIFRFNVEFLRSDPRGMVKLAGFTLSTSQIISIFLLIIAVAAYVWRMPRRKES